MNTVVAERKLVYSAKDSPERRALIVRIGMPYLDKDGVAKCPVAWEGLFEDFADIAGIDTLHALQLASNIDSMLEKLREKYDFFWDSGDPYFDDSQ
ncbi:MAG TPA: hypothetical protein VGO61_04500 [Steroidobacteraceae bacterium]|jgi:hypothetical protein|nr:hypothetical protein [Steroidobacteraceae bacterium]